MRKFYLQVSPHRGLDRSLRFSETTSSSLNYPSRLHLAEGYTFYDVGNAMKDMIYLRVKRNL